MLDPKDSWYSEHSLGLTSSIMPPPCPRQTYHQLAAQSFGSAECRGSSYIFIVEWAPFLLDRCRNWTGIYRYMCVYIYAYIYIHIYIYIDTYTYVCHILHRMFASTFSVLLRTKNLLLLLPGSSTCWEIRNPSMWWPCLRNGAPGISRDVTNKDGGLIWFNHEEWGLTWFKHVVRNLNVRPDSWLWHIRSICWLGK
jgi:hypothetical protein